MCEKNSFRFLFVFVLSQFRGPHCLGVWSRPGAAQLRSVTEIAPAQPDLCVNCAFSHDVMAAILVSQNNETAAMLVS